MSLYLVLVCVSAQSHIQGANGWKTKQARSAATDTQPPVGRPPPSEIQACDWSGSDRRDPGFLLVGSQAGACGTRGERNRVVLPPHQNLLRENFYNSCTCGKVLFRLFLYETSSARVYSGWNWNWESFVLFSVGKMTDVFFPEACQVVRKVGEEVSPDFEDCHKASVKI